MRGLRDAAAFLVGMPLMAAAAFGAFAAIIAVGWYTFLGWMWLWTLWLPLPRPIGGAFSVLCTAMTVYGLSKLAGEAVGRLRVARS